MKLTKLGWAGSIALGSLIALGTLAQAQEKKAEKPPAPAAPPAAPAAPGAAIANANAAARPDIRAARIDMRLKSMAQSLNLTDAQKEKVKPILEEELKKMEELQQDKAGAPEERMKKMREIREGSQAKIRPLLTADQQQKLDTLRAPRPQRRPEAPPIAPPAAK